MTRSIRMGLLFVGLVFSAAAAGVDDDQAELSRLLHVFLTGASVDDVDVHDRFWAEDLIYTGSDGRRYGKAEIMDSLAQPDQAGDGAHASPPEYSARDITIRVFGDTAVITFRLLAKRDDALVGQYFNTGVFRKREPGWQAVTWQATRAPEAGDQSSG